MIALSRSLTARKRAQLELAGGEQYRVLAEEYRRLTDLAVTAQEHTDAIDDRIAETLEELLAERIAVRPHRPVLRVLVTLVCGGALAASALLRHNTLVAWSPGRLVGWSPGRQVAWTTGAVIAAICLALAWRSW